MFKYFHHFTPIYDAQLTLILPHLKRFNINDRFEVYCKTQNEVPDARSTFHFDKK